MYKTIYYIRKLVFTVFVATFLLALGAALTSVYTLERYESTSAGAICGVPSATDAKSEQIKINYCVKECDGIIGVYDASDELMYKVEVHVKTLPERDRELLKSGILADSYGEVLEILGDYTG